MSLGPGSWVFGPAELRPAEHRLLVNGQPVALGSRAFDLLCILMARRDRVVSKDELIDAVWRGRAVEENNLQVQVSNLRRVLGAQAITTVIGLGYRFTLPIATVADASVGAKGAQAGLASTAPQPPPPALPAPITRVLVADDNPAHLLRLRGSLAQMGCLVGSAASGRQALDQLRVQRFDLLVLDLSVLDEDGGELLSLLSGNAAHRRPAVIVTSALSDAATSARCIALGVDDVLRTPVAPWLLRARVESCLARPRQRPWDRRSDPLHSPPRGAADTATRLGDACVLVARLHGLADIADADTLAEALEALSRGSALMLDAVSSNDGAAIQLGGDGMIALFSEPLHAVAAAGRMLSVASGLQAEAALARAPGLGFGIGLARGPVLLGLVSIRQRAAHACIGAPLLRAERLAAIGARHGHPILVDPGIRGGLPGAAAGFEVQGDEGLSAFVLPSSP